MENQLTDMRFTKGFNDGYIISSFDYELKEKLIGKFDVVTNEYWIGFSKGLQEMDKEKVVINEFDNIRNNENDKNIER